VTSWAERAIVIKVLLSLGKTVNFCPKMNPLQAIVITLMKGGNEEVKTK
jgi:hypothetical protein